MKDYPVDMDYFDQCKKRVVLAVKIDRLEHQTNKEKSNSNWYEKHAKLLDIELDDDILKENFQDENVTSKNKRNLHKLKQELDQELKKAIFPKGMSKKYLRVENIDKVININCKFQFHIYSSS